MHTIKLKKTQLTIGLLRKLFSCVEVTKFPPEMLGADDGRVVLLLCQLQSVFDII